MHRKLVIDIETAGQGKRANEWTDNMHHKMGNLKDPEKIKVKMEEKRIEARSKHALSWWTGQIISIATYDVEREEMHSKCGHDEIELLKWFTSLCPSHIIGKTSKNFDFPFMVGRYMANNLPMPSALKSGSKTEDIDNYFGFSSASQQRTTLAAYCHGLGIKGKLMDGANVPRLYADICMGEMEGKDMNDLWNKILEYNEDDVMKTYEIYRRYVQ